MKTMAEIEKTELREVMGKCWMTHDGMWFFHCFRELGIETANRLNKAAIASLAGIEVGRMARTLGFEPGAIRTWGEFQAFVSGVSEVFLPRFMRISLEFPGENELYAEFEPEKCFAYLGIKSIGALDRYECGVFYRLECWFRELGFPFQVEPEVLGCMMPGAGRCYRRYRFESPRPS
ncbi:MAG: DUF6125 family protein [Thermodesulfobacteriota bacterium]